MIIVLNKVLIKKQTHFCSIYNNNNKIIQLKHSKDVILLSFLCIISFLCAYKKEPPHLPPR